MRPSLIVALAGLMLSACPSRREASAGDSARATSSPKRPAASKGAARKRAASKRAARENKPAARRVRRRRGLSGAERAEFLRELRRGRALAAKRRYSDAINALRRAVALHPTNVPALSELGWTLFRNSQLELADRSLALADRYAKSVSSPDVRRGVLYNLGRVAERRSERRTALRYYKAAQAISPNNKVVRARVRALETAAANTRADEPDEPVLKGASLGAICAQFSRRRGLQGHAAFAR